MTAKGRTSLLMGLALLVVGIACSLSSESQGCNSPTDLTASDLAGTWVNLTINESDTLIIREDGYYQQLMHAETPLIDYTSEWQKWRLEYEEDGTAYVRFDKMNLCVYSAALDCQTLQDGFDQGRAGRWDYCQEKTLYTPGEGVLIVLLAPEGFVQPPRGFSMQTLQVFTEGGVRSYELEETEGE